MPPRFWVAITLLMTTLAAVSPLSASVINMKNGIVYKDVTVLRRDAHTITIHSAYGNATLPLAMVARIDGERVIMGPNVSETPVDGIYGEPLPLPAIPSVRATPRPAARRLTGTASNSAKPPVVTAPQSPRQEHWNVNWPILLGEVGFSLIWALTIVFGQRILRSQPNKKRLGLYITIFLPIIGFLWIVARTAKRSTVSSPTAAKATAFEFLDGDHRSVEINLGVESSGIERAQDILKDAMLDRASDVHIEPGSDEYRIRFRVNGQLHSRIKFPASEGLRLVSAIKSLSQMDISERRKAQDGRFGARSHGRDVDFRVATTPSVHGEKLVLRILDHRSGLRGLGEMGMSQTMMEQFGQVIHSRSGMIVATGPTGSGKTSTLYTALSQLDSMRLNVVTIEDPVEYQLAGATQIPVNLRLNVTYESGLRSILRQDPDVILVGEMRDLEAAKIALRSALTGHLVFSTLHARDAIGTVMRLEEMGIERHLVASSLFVVLAQRLVPVLCLQCRQAYPCVGNELVEVGIQLPAGATLYRATGCRQCDGTGYTDRTGVFEMLVLDDEIRQAVNNNMSEDDLTALARTKGYRSYREEAAQKALLGITSVEEVLKAI